jgi:predicted GNAT family acetyltransferase
MSEVRDAPELARYEIRDGDDLVGFVDYVRTEGQITFTHTETFPARQGHGFASDLVTAALVDARQQGLTVVPRCWFVRDLIADRPDEFLDLVPAELRSRFGLPAAG